MSAPAVQIYSNDEKIKVYWSRDTTGTYRGFFLYYDTASTMAAEAKVSDKEIPNVVDTTYSREHIIYTFNRSAISMPIGQGFFVRLKGVTIAGAEDVANPGPTKYLPSTFEKSPQYNAVIIHGYDPEFGVYRPTKMRKDSTGGSNTGEIDTF